MKENQNTEKRNYLEVELKQHFARTEKNCEEQLNISLVASLVFKYKSLEMVGLYGN